MSSKKNRKTMRGLLPTGPGRDDYRYDSGLERSIVTLELFRPDPPIVSRPETLRYQDGCGKRRRYTPDILVVECNPITRLRGRLLEVKGGDELQIGCETWRERYLAAQRWAQEKGYRFEVRTEGSIHADRLRNAREFLPYRYRKVRLRAVRALLATLEAMKRCRARTLIDAALVQCPHEAELVEALWRLIADFHICFDIEQRFTLESEVWLPPESKRGHLAKPG
jgi:hypothetical protein